MEALIHYSFPKCPSPLWINKVAVWVRPFPSACYVNNCQRTSVSVHEAKGVTPDAHSIRIASMRIGMRIWNRISPVHTRFQTSRAWQLRTCDCVATWPVKVRKTWRTSRWSRRLHWFCWWATSGCPGNIRGTGWDRKSTAGDDNRLEWGGWLFTDGEWAGNYIASASACYERSIAQNTSILSRL